MSAHGAADVSATGAGTGATAKRPAATPTKTSCATARCVCKRSSAPQATNATIRFQAQGFVPGKPYELRVTAPNGTNTSFAVTGLQPIALRAALPAGKSTFRLVASGTPSQQVSPSDLRVVSIRVSEWTIS